MALYKYIKTYPKQSRRRGPKGRLVSGVLILAGFGLLIWALGPILTFQILSEELFSGTVSPLSRQDRAPNASRVLAAAEGPDDSFQNYLNPNVWFPSAPQLKVAQNVKEYTLSIPKLKIVDARVIIGGDSLEKGLIHYGGTAMPGTSGNSVVFGHSTLPQLYDPRNYRTIFSLLPSLKPAGKGYDGDLIYVTFDGLTYKYVITEMTVTRPSDISPLEQTYDNSYLTLITCVPPGTYWERLNVKAKLVPIL
ncbi:hypothetical protein A2Z33_06815 [Candidatus Gottesmanbacteria bacterium RBG_16_52_11]|uniref:Sortase n=1 Tax=Candidatus Gottesmanbacteria bacterium RBG_16_52_11 TaxID=1798374 RepID=A0A1F5YY13_9BACT|nr:MAG: hypothetical protein A2Z33_06815 [Candidatus Gottesmanbacteria bacterium RBG_16_52_11]